jgi:hypothetical protein
MNWVGTWSSKRFGYMDGEDLWTHDGRHVGKLRNRDDYGTEGRYLGEIQYHNRLLTKTDKKVKQDSPFTPLGQRIGHYPYADCRAKFMHPSYEDFPEPEKL